MRVSVFWAKRGRVRTFESAPLPHALAVSQRLFLSTLCADQGKETDGTTGIPHLLLWQCSNLELHQSFVQNGLYLDEEIVVIRVLAEAIE